MYYIKAHVFFHFISFCGILVEKTDHEKGNKIKPCFVLPVIQFPLVVQKIMILQKDQVCW